MIGMTATVIDETAKVEEAVERTGYRSLGHAAASIRKEAVASIEKSAEPSKPGEPPHTRRGQLPRAVRYAVEDKWTAVIGPRASIVGESAEPHEKGGRYKGQEYPERPLMGPALEANLDRFAREWEGGLG